jgi:serine/threonine protein kinase
MTSSSSLLYPGFVLESRYEIVRILGQGGFGRTYLAKDLNRFGEHCVLKEFAPQVQGANALKKATELFQREAGVLYKLQHSQIPAFRELLQVKLSGTDCLLLIEDYVAGATYADLLHQGRRFTEADVLELLRNLLPVLTYLHQNGVIHRDISPDNLICEQTTGLPILIDFGSVKHIVTQAVKLTTGVAPTQIEKAGYTPIEQINGTAFPSSDLYALAVTLLVLLSNKSPLELYNSHDRTWRWQAHIQVSTGLATILQHMLADRDVDRYQSAHEVQQALQALTYAGTIPAPSRTSSRAPSPNLAPVPPAAAPPTPSVMKTWVVSPARPPSPPPVPLAPPPAAFPAAALPAVALDPSRRRRSLRPLRWLGRSLFWLITLPFYLIWGIVRLVNGIFTLVWRLVIMALVVAVLAIAAWWFKPAWLPQFTGLPQLPVVQNDTGCQEKILARVEALGTTTQVLYPQVNQKFYQRYPQLKNRMLTDQPEDAQFRRAWCAIAEELLDASDESSKQQVQAN